MKNSTQHLNIFYENMQVGILFLNETNDETSLKYSEEWKNKGFPLSPSLPLNEDFNHTAVNRFIENLLPEGEGLETVSRFLQIAKSNVFGLLGAIGAETVGALSFFLSNDEKQSTKYRKIEKDELEKRINERAYTPITIWDGKPRLSVAGVQEKLPVIYIDGEYGLGDGKLCSTHLLKFEKNKENLIINEYLSLKLAKLAGTKVCDAQIKKFGEHYALLVERFDRKIKIIDESKNKPYERYQINRMHMIDACQGLGLSSSFKYERPYGSSDATKDIRTGVNIEKLASLVQQCKIPALEMLSLINWIIVNLCIGNSDAHGKNISFFSNEKGLSLTPFYDIVNITLYNENYDTSLAMAIGDEFNIEKIMPYDLAELCDTLKIKPALLVRSFENISKKIEKGLNDKNLLKECLHIDKAFVEKYRNNIQERIALLKKAINSSEVSHNNHFVEN